MKKYMLYPVCLILLACGILSILAGFGILAKQNVIANKNLFGGIGEIRQPDYLSGSYVQDDARLYYLGYPEMWNNGVYALCWFDPVSNTAGTVCNKPACSHTTTDCPLYPLYQADKGFVFELSSVDCNQYYAQFTKKEMLIRKWNPLTDEKTTVSTFPRYKTIGDSAGMTAQQESWFNFVRRVNDDKLLIVCNNIAYLCDNDYNILSNFPFNGDQNFIKIKSAVFWAENGTTCFYPESGVIEYNVLQKKLNCDYPFASLAFGYDNQLYFVYDGAVRMYDPIQKTVDILTKTDSETESMYAICSRVGDNMYYFLDGIVHCMNLKSKLITEMSEMPNLPLTQLNGFLIVPSSESPKGIPSDFIRFNLAGRAVTT